MEVSPAGSFSAGSLLESPEQPDRAGRSEEFDLQESMFDAAVSFDAAESSEEMSGALADAAEEPVDRLPEEAVDHVDEPPYAREVQAETAATAHREDHSDWKPEAETQSAPEADAGSPKVLTADDFSALEERVLKAVSLVRREREARLAAEERLLVLESQMLAQAPTLEQLHQEIDALRAEREQVRQRVERLLSQLDALEL
jgi:uncharacterized coiled-coil protein SlyX